MFLQAKVIPNLIAILCDQSLVRVLLTTYVLQVLLIELQKQFRWFTFFKHIVQKLLRLVSLILKNLLMNLSLMEFWNWKAGLAGIFRTIAANGPAETQILMPRSQKPGTITVP